MSKTSVLDMTKGKPLPLIVRFSIPLILSAFFQQLYTFVDTAIVGRCIDVNALSAVGITSPLTFLVLGFTMSSATGFSIPISQSVGAGDREAVLRYFWNGLYLCLLISLVISVAAGIFTDPLLRLINTPQELFEMASIYLTIIFFGQTTTILYNYLSGVIRALGDSVHPFYFLLLSSGANIVLDLMLIRLTPLGVAGAALATVLSQVISVALCVWWLGAKMGEIRLRSENGAPLYHFCPECLERLAVVGLPLGLSSSVCSIGNLILQRAINTLGVNAAAAQICGERIRTLATLPMESVGTAMATYVGQNYGARDVGRIKEGVRSAFLIQAVNSVAAWVILFALKKPLIYLLLGETTGAVAEGAAQYLTIITVFFIFHGSLMVLRNTVQGMGFSATALFSSVMEIIGRSAAGFLAVRLGSFVLICLSSPIAWMLAASYCAALCVHYLKKTTREFAPTRKSG